MWAEKNDMRSYINQDKISEFLADGYVIYSDEMELIDNPEDYAVDTMEEEGRVSLNE